MKAQRITVLGLGQLGLPVAAALAGAGHVVMGVDPRAERCAAASAQGLQAAQSLDAGLPAPWLVSLLPDDTSLMAALAAPDAVAPLSTGGVHMCIGTIGVATAQTLAEWHAARGQYFVAAPVFGRPDEAWARDLTALFGPVAGMPAALRAEALALLGCVAPRRHEAASPAAACAVKLAGNLMIASAIATLTEASLLATQHGAPAALLHEVITGKLFKGPVYEGVGRAVASACDHPGQPAAAPGFTVQLGLKDLLLCHEAARAVGHELPVGQAVQQRLEAAVARGHGGRDWAELPACLG